MQITVAQLVVVLTLVGILVGAGMRFGSLAEAVRDNAAEVDRLRDTLGSLEQAIIDLHNGLSQ
jgi:hypothetical protein